MTAILAAGVLFLILAVVLASGHWQIEALERRVRDLRVRNNLMQIDVDNAERLAAVYGAAVFSPPQQAVLARFYGRGNL